MMRFRFVTVSILALLAPSAFAQGADPAFDAAATIEDFLTDTALLGAERATVGAVRTDGNVVTAENVTMAWSVTVDTPEGGGSMTADATIPTLVVTGLQPTDTGYAYDEIAMPAATFNLRVAGADMPISYEITTTDNVMTGGSWGRFPQIVANPAAPVSRFAPLVDWAINQSYTTSSVGKIDLVSELGTERQTMSYGPVTLGPVENGQLANLEYDAFSVEQTGAMPSADGTTNPFVMTFDYGRITGTDIDMRPLAAFLTGNGDTSGPQNVIGGLTLDSIKMTDGEMINFSMGPIVVDNVTVDPSRGPLMEKLDGTLVTVLSGGEPDPMTSIGLLLDIYGGYGFGRYSFSDVEMAFPGFTGGLGGLTVEGFDASGMKRFAVENGMFSGTGSSGKLDLFEVSDIVFPARDAFMALIMGSVTGGGFNAASLAGFPTLGGVVVEGLSATPPIPDAAPIEVGRFELALTDYIAAIPTKLGLTLDGFQMPLALVQDPRISMILAGVGADPVRADVDVSLTYSEADGTVNLDESAEVANVGTLETNAALSGIPRAIFENPMRANEAIATAAIGGMSVRFEDQGITPFMLGMMAEQAGIDAQAFAQGITQQIEMQVSAITGDGAFGSEIGSTLRAFLADPRSLTITAMPANPVPAAQIMGAAVAAPQQIPQLLNLSISAND